MRDRGGTTTYKMEGFSMKTILPSVLLLVLLVIDVLSAGEQYIVYCGAYTKTTNKGIMAFRLIKATGKMEPLGLAAEIANPSFLALHPNAKYLYAVSETASTDQIKTGAVSAFLIDPRTAKLTLLNTVSSHGGGPCYVSVDHTGKFVLVANYGSGSIAALPIKTDGRLAEFSSFVQHSGSSVHPERQAGPHAHSIQVSPDNRFVLAADLGVNKLFIYRFDAEKGLLSPNDPPFIKLDPGAGPRHFAFTPKGRFVYVINELNSTVTAMSYDKATGTMTAIQTASTLPAEFQGENTTAEIRVHPNGNFLYCSNRGHDSIALFRLDKQKGTMELLGHTLTLGKTPRNFNITPGGEFLIAANQNSDSIILFRIDRTTGKLTATDQRFEVAAPVCITFLSLD
jgi:6-phosphogluconolactonase